MSSETTLGEYVGSTEEGSSVLSRAVLTAEEALHAARYYHGLGWAVTAGPGLDSLGHCACAQGSKCNNPGKHAYAGWGEPTRRTMTLEEIEKYWNPDNGRWIEKPVDHVFLVPYLSGLAIADVDRMEDWLSLPEELRPETLWVESGSGRGGHFFYRYSWDMTGPAPSLPGKLPNRSGELKFRGIVVAPPSVHKSGGKYKWASDAADWFSRGVSEIPEIPEGLVETSKRTYGAKGESLENMRAGVKADGTMEFWTAQLFAMDRDNLLTVAKVLHGKPVAMFAAAAGIARWVEVGAISEDEVVEILLDASVDNGAFDKYGENELKRQILNGIETGRRSLEVGE